LRSLRRLWYMTTVASASRASAAVRAPQRLRLRVRDAAPLEDAHVV